MSTFTVDTSHAMEAFGRWLATQLEAGDVVVLTGPLGAGKTTLARGLGEGLMVTSPVQSPTFIVAREHDLANNEGLRLVHVDAYRLGSAAELDDLDIDWPGSISVIEWGQPYVAQVADCWLHIEITPVESPADDFDAWASENAQRMVTVTAHSKTGAPPARLQTIAEAHHDFGP